MKTLARKHKTSRQPLRMINISDKPTVRRVAEAEGKIWLQPKTIEKIRKGLVEKGDVFSTADLAGILAVKKTPELIPLCHQIPLSQVDISFDISQSFITTRCRVVSEYKTGVEMEALVGVTVTLLTIWDMVKYLEKDKVGQYPHTKIGEVGVLKKEKEPIK